MMEEPHTKSFSCIELRCSCYCCGKVEANKCDVDALEALQRVRDVVGFPLYLTSAYRCESHPAESKKQKPGFHHSGQAFDISISWGSKRMEIIAAALDNGCRGIGFAETYIHVDWGLRSNGKTTWGYS